MSSIGDRLKRAREWKHLTQIQVKERTNINNKTLSGYEKSVSIPDNETIKLLAGLYEVNPAWVVGFTDDPSPQNQNNMWETVLEVISKFEKGLIRNADGSEMSEEDSQHFILGLKKHVRDNMGNK
ncbi:helix-turn-helix transcriptional regulator [Tumebacillus sp. ITR2]|uniref:Helix-turn-helix transcriptional regulator n=1 Tax=Tumebacillus amylolyticus TaxID=2801339 RepID=A0ABS1JC62_9BACL|nr:helix-turn-helix transcriptional regulator [Tumebacillus amylolyticus]MBL0387861.1 helix-turn-helix transcriptional regulator [Tumebacillus amylolyticus]